MLSPRGVGPGPRQDTRIPKAKERSGDLPEFVYARARLSWTARDDPVKSRIREEREDLLLGLWRWEVTAANFRDSISSFSVFRKQEIFIDPSWIPFLSPRYWEESCSRASLWSVLDSRVPSSGISWSGLSWYLPNYSRAELGKSRALGGRGSSNAWASEEVIW